MEKTGFAKEEMEGLVFISRQSRHISFVIIMIKVLFPTLYLYMACKQLFPAKEKLQIGEMKVLEKEIFNIFLIIS